MRSPAGARGASRRSAFAKEYQLTASSSFHASLRPFLSLRWAWQTPVRKKTKETQAEQSKRFIETARKLGVDETEAGHERAFGKVGLKKPKKQAKKK